MSVHDDAVAAYEAAVERVRRISDEWNELDRRYLLEGHAASLRHTRS